MSGRTVLSSKNLPLKPPSWLWIPVVYMMVDYYNISVGWFGAYVGLWVLIFLVILIDNVTSKKKELTMF